MIFKKTIILLAILLAGCAGRLVEIEFSTPKVIGTVYNQETNQPIAGVNIKVGPVVKNGFREQYLHGLSKGDGTFEIQPYTYFVEIKSSHLNKQAHSVARSPYIHLNHQEYIGVIKDFVEYLSLDQKSGIGAPKYYSAEKNLLNMRKIYLKPKSNND